MINYLECWMIPTAITVLSFLVAWYLTRDTNKSLDKYNPIDIVFGALDGLAQMVSYLFAVIVSLVSWLVYFAVN